MLNYKRFVLILIVLFLFGEPELLFAQSKGETYKIYNGKNKDRWVKKLAESASGLKYEIIIPGDGIQPRPGDVVRVHYIGVLDNEIVFDNSYERSQPLEFNLGVGQVIKGWDEGIGYLREGGKAKFVVPPSLGYGNRSAGDIPANSTLYFEVELLNVDQTMGVNSFDVTGLDTVRTNSGLQYIIVDKGEGVVADTSFWVTMHFTGYLPSNKIFDSSILRKSPVKFQPGHNTLLAAWDEIVRLLPVGSKVHMVVPAHLAYADKGLSGVVPPNTDLTFDIEIVDAKKKRVIKPYTVKGKDTIKLASGLQYIVVEKGSGDSPKDNDVVSIQYTGYLSNGKMFQSSLDQDEPIMFAVGKNMVIPGFDEVVRYMREGAKFRVLIPWQLGYGKEGYPPDIPPKENLIFDVEFIGVVG